jgi:hypothetical protein
MELLIIYDQNGRIIAVGEVSSDESKQSSHTNVVLAPGQSLLRLERAGQIRDQRLDEIGKEYKVDVERKELVRHTTAEGEKTGRSAKKD